jgi:hypothetical protein
MTITRTIAASSLVAVAMGSPSLALAEDTFQAEAGLSYSRFKADGTRLNTAGAEATYFFDKLPTQPKDYPLEQAQFVERIGSVTANYGRSTFNIDNFDSLKDGSMYGATVDFRRPGTPLIVSAGYESFYSGKLRDSSFPFFETEADTKSYLLSVGAYVAKTTTLSLDWSRSRTRTKFMSLSVPSTDSSDTFTSIGFSGQHLARLSREDYIAVVVGIFQDKHEQDGAASEKNRTFFLQATYYPTKRLGLTLGVSSDRGEDPLSEGETYEAGVKMFVTPTISLGLDYQRFLAKAPGNDDNLLTLKALMRF